MELNIVERDGNRHREQKREEGGGGWKKKKRKKNKGPEISVDIYYEI